MITHSISKNVKFAAINYSVVNIIKFIVRMVFIKTLPIEYLGLNGLFSNVLAMLSLAELGIGPAIVYSLYKPIAYEDKETIKSIMYVFKKVYIGVGVLIFILGLSLLPNLEWFIKSPGVVKNLELIYLIFLLNTSISYFWSYQRNLLIAAQKHYLVNMYQTIVQICISCLQIFSLLAISDYGAFLFFMVLGTVLENYVISRKTYKLFSFLKEPAQPLKKEISVQIIKNVKAMIAHKIGGMVVVSSSNIIISKFIGLGVVGIYSNYYMIINAINTLAGKCFESITASIGNMMISCSDEEKIFTFSVTQFITAYQASVITVGLATLFNPFIKLWIGKNYLFDNQMVIAMVASFYLMYMRKCVLMFKDASGLFWYDRYKPIAEAFINIIASVVLIKYVGIIGIVYGNIISTLTTCFWVEPYVLFKYGIKYRCKKYYFNYVKYTLLTVIIVIINKNLYDVFLSGEGIINFLLCMVVSIIVPTILWIGIFWKSKELLFIKKLIFKEGFC